MPPPRNRAAAALPCVLLGLALCLPAKGVAEKGWSLPQHSFERTLSYDGNLAEWLMSAGSTALRDRVQLLPPVPRRHALAWHRQPITTQDFEVTFTLSAVLGDRSQGSSGMLTFWLSKTNFASGFDERQVIDLGSGEWAKGLESKDLGLHGQSPRFKGVGITFAAGEGEGQQTVSLAVGDGNKAFTVNDLRSGPAVSTKDWVTAGTQVRVRVRADGAVKATMMAVNVATHLSGTTWAWASDGYTGRHNLTFQDTGKVTWDGGVAHGSWQLLPGNKIAVEVNSEKYVVRFEGSDRAVVEDPQMEPRPTLLRNGAVNGGGNTDEWTPLFDMPPGTFNSADGTFFGFSGFSGSGAYLEVDVHRFEAVNFDQKTAGEGAVTEEWMDREWANVLQAERRHIDQATQGQAVVKLTQVLETHIASFEKAGQEMRQNLGVMEDRLEGLSSGIGTHLSAMQAFSFEKDAFEPDMLRHQIQGLRSVLQANQESNADKLSQMDGVAKDLKERKSGDHIKRGIRRVHRARGETKTVQEFASHGSLLSSVMLFILISVVICLGFLFHNRMRYYEKKHYV